MYRTKFRRWAAVLAVACIFGATVSALEQRRGTAASIGGGKPPLIDAVKRQDVSTIRGLLAQGADVNAPEPDGTTALHWAAQHGNAQIVDALLAAGGNVHATNRYGIQPLLLACEAGQVAIVGRLLGAGADANIATPGGQTALMTAARTGKAEAVKLLLTRGAAVDAAEPLRGQTALMWAAVEGHVEAIDALIAGGADIRATSRGPQKPIDLLDHYAKPIKGQGRLDSFTPLMFAVQAGHISATRTLLERGANVNDTAPDGTSALVLAIANAHYELAGLLLDHGADPNLNGQGWNALVQLVRTKNPSIGQQPPLIPTGRMSPMELAKKILARGVKIDDPITQLIRDRFRTRMDMVGATAYIMAAKAADAEMMRLLVAAGANPFATTKAERTALMVAAGIDMWYLNEDSGTTEDAFEAFKVALEAGSDVNAVNADGDTALHGAAHRGSNEMVQVLIDRGAKLDVKNKLGFTPLMVANGDQRIGCNLQRRPWTVELLTKMMTERGIPVMMRSDSDKFEDGVSRGYSAADSKSPKC